MAYENQYKKRARAVGAAIGRAATGTHQIGIEFQFLDEQGGITYYGPLSDKAFPYTMKAIRAAGFVGEDLSDLSSLNSDDVPDVVLVIEDEEYPEGSGKVAPKVKFINSTGGLAMKDALQGSDLKAFAQQMKGKIVAFDRSAGAPKPAPRRAPVHGDTLPQEELDRQASSNGGGPDDIPF
jgi:hypothetical protein